VDREKFVEESPHFARTILDQPPAHGSEALYCSFPPSKWKMRIRRVDVQPAARVLVIEVIDFQQLGASGSSPEYCADHQNGENGHRK